jgi:hypothetical protein
VWVLCSSLVVILLLLGMVLVVVFVVRVMALVGVISVSDGSLVVSGDGPGHALFGFFSFWAKPGWML